MLKHNIYHWVIHDFIYALVLLMKQLINDIS